MKLSTLFLLLYSCLNFAQSKPLLEKIAINGSIKIIGMYPQYDKTAKYKKFNFYIDDQNIIKGISKNYKFLNKSILLIFLEFCLIF